MYSVTLKIFFIVPSLLERVGRCLKTWWIFGLLEFSCLTSSLFVLMRNLTELIWNEVK